MLTHKSDTKDCRVLTSKQDQNMGGMKPTSGHSYWLRRTGSIQPYNLFKNIGRDDVFSVIPRRLKSTERKKKTRNGG